ncbi:proline dehydrogenase [Aureococcus anophagefferens]|nr:proline dehydrogenase [Aureococcus anophagefferens]
MAMHSRRAVSLLRRAAPSVARPMHSRRAVSLLRRAGPSVVRPASTLPLPGDGAGGRLRFDDARLAFDGVPTADLVRALCVFQACGVGPLVAHGERLLAAARRVLGDRAVAAVVRPTFFAHFVAGEDEAEVRGAVEGLRSRGVGAISTTPPRPTSRRGASAPPRRARGVDYAGEAACDAARDVFAGAIEAVARVAPEDGFAAIKVTALGQPELLERWSSGSPRARARAAVRVADVISVKRMRELSALCREAGPFAAAALTEEEGALADAMLDRLDGLAALAAARGVRVMVDAEHTYFQPAIDHICLELMRKYNRGGGAVVHNTYQCYLTATAAKLERHAALANREGWHFGAKLVRGAYLHLERARAARLGYADPVHATIEDTHACFDAAVAFALARPDVRSGRSAANVLVASHNRASVERALDVMANEGLDARTSKVYFGQLLGMADHLTFTLGAPTPRRSPYELREVMPYLLRRAHENGDLLSSNVAGERALLVGELARRARAALGVSGLDAGP